jgi:hypothetical protein
MSVFKNSLKLGEPPKKHFFYQDELKVDSAARWKGPGGGPSIYFTTWSYYGIIATAIFAMVAIPALYLIPRLSHSRIVSSLIVMLITGFAVNSLAVAVTSQGLLSWDWKPLDPKAQVAISEDWVIKLTKVNATVHLIPTLLSLVLLSGLVTVPWSGSKRDIYIGACIIAAVFFFIWLCTPIYDKSVERNTTPLNKIQTVYNSPPAYLAAIQPVSILCFALLFVYILRGRQVPIK